MIATTIILVRSTSDFDNPSGRGLPYEKIEEILDGLKSRQKLVLIDTCHAGEVDKDDVSDADTKTIQPPVVSGSPSDKFSEQRRGASTPILKTKSFPNRGGKDKALLRLNTSQSFALMQVLFVDLRTTSGAEVIGASAGEELAVDDPKGTNGLFTFAVLEGLGGKAAKNKQGMITVSSLRDYVAERVSEISHGQQNPTARHENLAKRLPPLVNSGLGAQNVPFSSGSEAKLAQPFVSQARSLEIDLQGSIE